MSVFLDVEGYKEPAIIICPKGTHGEVIELGDILIALPKQPNKKNIYGYNKKKEKQRWVLVPQPEALRKIRSTDEWNEKPDAFKEKYKTYIDEEFRRRSEGFWFYNNGAPTYITGHHYMFLQWAKMDIGSPFFMDFQRKIFIHMQACFCDPRSLGQFYTKCRRSGYTNICSSIIVDSGTLVKNKLLGIQSKTGDDAQKNIFMKKVVPMYNGYPFFFKAIQDGTTNPRMELAFREPTKKLTKIFKSAVEGDALNTIISWKNTTHNAYDGDKLYRFFLDESGKWEKPANIIEAWRIESTSLIVGRKVVGKAMMGSTVNPMKKGGKEYKTLRKRSDVNKRNANGRTQSGLYSFYISALESLEGFFDIYGLPVVENPKEPIMGLDGEIITIGSREFLKNERDSRKNDSDDLNEYIRQFSFNEKEAFRDSVDGSIFDISRIYEQLEHNDELFPNPVVTGNFSWEGGVLDSKVVFTPSQKGKFRLAWLPPEELRSVNRSVKGVRTPSNYDIGVGGVDSYDLDATVDGRGSKGALHLYNKFNMEHPSNMFVLEYASRPPLAKIFYEDVLMASVFYGYPLLIENNKYGVARHFEERGYINYLLDRPKHLTPKDSRNISKTKGLPSNSQDILHAHAQAIESYIYQHVGVNSETGNMGRMYFHKTLDDWISFKIDNRTDYDLSISSGLALLASQKTTSKKQSSAFSESKFFRTYHNN